MPRKLRFRGSRDSDLQVIKTQVTRSTLLIFPEGEELAEVTTGDREFWVIEGKGRFVHVKPSKPGLVTNLNVILKSDRVYSFLLKEITKPGAGKTTETADVKVLVPADVDEMTQLKKQRENLEELVGKYEGELKDLRQKQEAAKKDAQKKTNDESETPKTVEVAVPKDEAAPAPQTAWEVPPIVAPVPRPRCQRLPAPTTPATPPANETADIPDDLRGKEGRNSCERWQSPWPILPTSRPDASTLLRQKIMTPPIIRKDGPSPTGALPRRAHWLVFLAITGAVIFASLFSGQKARQVARTAPPAGPAPSEVAALEKRLQIDKQALKESEERAKARLQELKTAPEPTHPANAAAPDPIEAERRARSARAPYSSSVVLHFEEHEPKVATEAVTQIALRIEDKKELPKDAVAKPAEPKLKESGLQLPLRDGDRHRLQQGTLIPTTLLNRLEGSFTGPVKCVVAKAILSEDETALLIPKGSEVYGQARKVEEANQTRLAITFDRLSLKNGYSVSLDGAPGLDSNGESGIAGKVNNHNVRKVTVGGVLGAIGGLALYAGAGGPYAAGVANSTGSSATNIMNRSLSSLPSITIPEGKTIYLYLPKDFVLPEYRPQGGLERTTK